MGKPSRPSGNKRARERAKHERNQEKEQRRLERRERKANAPPRTPGEDPDIAGIQPGPQPRDPEWLLPTETEPDEGTESKG